MTTVAKYNRNVLRVALLALSLGLSSLAVAQPPGSTLALDSAGDDVRKLLRQIDQMTADGQYDEAIDRLRRLMDQQGDVLIGTAESFKNGEPAYERYVPVREVCHARLAGWSVTHPAALAEYRHRVDPLAERWYRQAAERRDAALYEQLAEQMFASSYGDEALLRLGELRLEQGRYTAARRAWERISPALRAGPVLESLAARDAGRFAVPYPRGVAGGPLWLALPQIAASAPAEVVSEAVNGIRVNGSSPTYPDSNVNVAEVRARLVLVSIMEGAFERAELELDWMRRFDPEATGAIAGQSGKYVELLAAMLAEAHDWPPVALTEDWSSYAGDARRSGIAPSDVSAVTAFWHRDLPPVNLAATEQPRPMPVYFPVIVDEKVYVGDARHVWGFHLRDGSSLVKVIESGQLFAAPLPADRPQRAPSLAFTLHSDREQLLARLGPPPGNLPERTTEPDYGFFTSLDLQTFKLVWKAESTSLEFEGTPVCDRQRMYALAREAEGEDSVSLHVVCRELSDGRARWRSWICRNKQREFLNRLPPALLTLAEDTLYACTNLGCVAAIGTSDGRLRWALEYPRAMRPNPRGEGSLPPAPNPCLFHQGMVIAAPADAEQLLAIDAATGELLWTAPRSAWGSDHLLGVAHGNLIVGGDALRWIDVKNGLLRGRFPLAEFDEPGMSRPGPRGYGRGLLAGERVYWPTPEWIYVFEQAIADSRRGPSIVSAGQIDLRRMNVESGNLAASHGVLLIASPSRLAALGNPPAP